MGICLPSGRWSAVIEMLSVTPLWLWRPLLPFLLAGEQDTVAAGGFEAVTLRNPFLFLALAAQSTRPREDKKHKEKKLHKDLEADAPESKEQKPRDPDRDAKHRERMADRDRHGSREHPRGDRDKEKPRERRRDARDLDREKLRDKVREHDTEKHQSRGKDRERDREREGEHRVRREEPKPAARHHWPEHRMRSGACLGCGHARARHWAAPLQCSLPTPASPWPASGCAPAGLCALQDGCLLGILELISVNERSNGFLMC